MPFRLRVARSARNATEGVPYRTIVARCTVSLPSRRECGSGSFANGRTPGRPSRGADQFQRRVGEVFAIEPRAGEDVGGIGEVIGSMASATQWLAPTALSSMPPTQQGMPAAWQALWIFTAIRQPADAAGLDVHVAAALQSNRLLGLAEAGDALVEADRRADLLPASSA